MTSRQVLSFFALLPLSAAMLVGAQAQQEGLLPTQALIRPQSKQNILPTATALTLKLNDKVTPVLSLTQVTPATSQVALLIDDGLSRSAGVQLNDLREFATSLPPATELLVGYMSNGRIEVLIPFTTDHAAAAEKIRIPTGIPGISASPYFCLSDFVKHWPGNDESSSSLDGAPRSSKARFVMMITNGVDPYNGSTSLLNQDSPYVQNAVTDAQRAGVAVSSIYYRDAGFGGGSASFSGQSYLKQVSDGTGGESYYQGTFNPVSLTPFLKQFVAAISDTYIVSFNADVHGGGREHLSRLES